MEEEGEEEEEEENEQEAEEEAFLISTRCLPVSSRSDFFSNKLGIWSRRKEVQAWMEVQARIELPAQKRSRTESSSPT